jgi:hypothetical protein
MKSLDDLVRRVAEARRIFAEYKEQRIALQADIDAEIEERYGGERRRIDALLNTAGTDVLDADEALRAAALRTYEGAQDKHPHPAVTVKLFTALEYETEEALGYCREHLPKALKLDKRAFEKVARVVEPTFVTFIVEPRAQIDRDLSGYVEER